MSAAESGGPRIRRLLAEVQADHGALRDRTAEARSLLASEERDPTERAAALALTLDRSYTSLESILERIAQTLEGGVPESLDWHRTLLRNAGLEIERVRPRVLGPLGLAAADELRRFRHFLRHAYATRLDLAKVKVVARSWLAAAVEIDRDLDRIEKFLDELARRLDAGS